MTLKKLPENRREDLFHPGVYRHFKGGFYSAIGIGWMEEFTPRVRGVVYLSMQTGELHMRPWAEENFASFLDFVMVDDRWVPRFKYMGPKI